MFGIATFIGKCIVKLIFGNRKLFTTDILNNAPIQGTKKMNTALREQHHKITGLTANLLNQRAYSKCIANMDTFLVCLP
ncbi:hypothetical protein D3C81_1286380 [compost metagenome]